MAIYSLSHSAVGKTTHAGGTAGAHARYVTREGAAREILGEHMPTGRQASQAWLDAQELADRKNARVIDKVLLALPIELDAAERAQLVRDFAAEVGKGRIPWMAGIHDRGEDAGNPHAHVIFRDRDHETGKRVAELSGKGSTERLRETWERVANAALERAGVEQRIDRRSLEAQGIARLPGIHIGPNVLAMDERGVRPTSRVVFDGKRVIDWPSIDQGRTRIDRQAEIEAANDDREQEKERGGRDGKGRSDPMPTASPANQNEPDRSDDLAAREGEEQSRNPIQEMPQQQERDGADEGRGLAAREGPKAAQQPSPTAQTAARQAELPFERQNEPSRLRQAIDRARERLEALGQRLDRAMEKLRERFKEPEKKPQPERDQATVGRSLFEDFSRGRQLRKPGGPM